MEIKIEKLKKKEIAFFYQEFEAMVLTEFTYYSQALRKFLANNPRGITIDSLRYLNKIGAILLIAYNKQKQIVGILIADNPYLGVSFCTWIMVKKEFQGKGIGKLLIQEWEKLSFERGAHAVRLETTIHTQKFYQKLGFTLIGIDENGYCGIDKYLFKKQLNDPIEKNILQN